MTKKCFRPPRRGKPALRTTLAAAVLLAAGVQSIPAAHAQTSGPYSLNWSTVSVNGGGIAHLRSQCFILSGSIDFQSAPNNTSIFYGNGGYTLYSGFWWTTPISNLDEIFFDGFEECR